MTTCWSVEQVQALCPSPSRLAAARGLAVAGRWVDVGSDDRALWGRYHGGSGEPYEVAVDHVHVATRCTCPARARPCKHALALLLLWVQGQVPAARSGADHEDRGDARPSGVTGWLSRASPPERHVAPAPAKVGPAGPTGRVPGGPSGSPAGDRPRTQRDQRVARLGPALVELDRWLADRARTGLADPTLARYQTWDQLAARLVDAQAGSLANRVRRIGGQVGVRPGWHEHVLAELGILHLLAEGGQRLHDLPTDLADGVAVALGWQVRQSDVLAGVPERDRWLVAARSDAVEDRIVVRRTWLWGSQTHRWAMVLGFAAHGQALDGTLSPGCSVEADLFRYPGAVQLRALVGHVHDAPRPEPDLADQLPATTLGGACHDIGQAFAAEPWIERFPGVVVGGVRPRPGGGSGVAGWVLADAQGSLPLHPDATAVADLAACSAAADVVLTFEWTTLGALPVAVHLPGRTVELGPSANGGARWR